MKLIPLSNGMFAKVDDADYELVAHMKWHATKGVTNRTYYARATGRGSHKTRQVYYMHRLIMGLHGAPRSIHIDHHNGDSLDNRRANLRIATTVQNGGNRVGQKSQSGFKGVFPSGLKWRARMGKGPGTSLGFFGTPEEAARAYDAAARKKYGQFARLNFPEAGEFGCVVHAEPAPFDREAYIEKCRKAGRDCGRRKRDAAGVKPRMLRRARTDASNSVAP